MLDVVLAVTFFISPMFPEDSLEEVWVDMSEEFGPKDGLMLGKEIGGFEKAEELLRVSPGAPLQGRKEDCLEEQDVDQARVDQGLDLGCRSILRDSY